MDQLVPAAEEAGWKQAVAGGGLRAVGMARWMPAVRKEWRVAAVGVGLRTPVKGGRWPAVWADWRPAVHSPAWPASRTDC